MLINLPVLLRSEIQKDIRKPFQSQQQHMVVIINVLHQYFEYHFMSTLLFFVECEYHFDYWLELVLYPLLVHYRDHG